jgi:hypothetical protein
MKKIIFTLLVLLSFNLSKGQEIATTESGKKVMLFNDGTYKVITEAPIQSKINKESDSTNSNQSVYVQCSGTTKKGSRCKRMVKTANGRCYQH